MTNILTMQDLGGVGRHGANLVFSTTPRGPPGSLEERLTITSTGVSLAPPPPPAFCCHLIELQGVPDVLERFLAQNRAAINLLSAALTCRQAYL